jgi:hypothetical protein
MRERRPSFVTPVNGYGRDATPADELLAFDAMRRHYREQVRAVHPRCARIVAAELRSVVDAIGTNADRVPREAQVFIHLAIATVATLGRALDEVAKGEP